MASPSSVRHDRVLETPLCGSLAVAFLWLVDWLARVLESHRLDQGAWVVAGTWGGSGTVRMPPFQDVALDLDEWWVPEVVADAER